MTDVGHVLVVGGTRGLGRLVVDSFLARGFAVTALSRNRPAADCPDPAFHHLSVDLEDLDGADDLVSRVLDVGGPLRYIIFCQRYRGTGDSWRGEIQVSLTATKVLIDGFAKHFCGHGDRAIAVVSSVYARFVGGSQPASYHVAKAGLNGLVRYYACALGRTGIRVNAIMPLTYIKPETRDFYGSNKALSDLYARLVPLGRLGEASDSANLLDFLCSAKAGFINGQCLFIDGGVSAVWAEEVAKTFG